MKDGMKNYFSNLKKQKYFMLDVVNVVLGIAILILTGITIANNGKLIQYLVVFILGTILMALNLYKNLKKGSSLSLVFAFFTLMMTIVTGYIIITVIRMGI